MSYTNSVGSFKFLPSGCKDIGIRKFQFVAMTRFLFNLIFILGWSIGGYTASWLAMNYPEIKGLVSLFVFVKIFVKILTEMFSRFLMRHSTVWNRWRFLGCRSLWRVSLNTLLTTTLTSTSENS